MTPSLVGLTGATLQDTPSVCHHCVWWQSRGARGASKEKWIREIEDDWGAWGTVYYDHDGRVLGSMQFGPASHFPRGAGLPAGPPSDDAVLVTCAIIVDRTTPWVLQSLFLAAIGDAKERGAKALEAFGYHYDEGVDGESRFHLHRTVFPSDFLADFGFYPVRIEGRVELARLELGGVILDPEPTTARVLRELKGLLLPQPVAPRSRA
jgi:hypothetical protein